MVLNNSWNSQDPVQVAKGGTGIATTTAYAPIVGGTTATGAFQAASTGLSSSGYVLTSNGASAVPSFQVLPTKVTTVNGNSGSVTGDTITIMSSATDGTSNFSGSGTTLTFNESDAIGNTGFGYGTCNGITSGQYNCAFGFQCLQTCSTSTNNSAFGFNSMQFTTGGSNSAFGTFSLYGLTGGVSNSAFGNGCFSQVVGGNYNTGVGDSAGSGHTGSDTGNICIGYNVTGTAGDDYTTRIGLQGTQTACYVAGISGVSTSNSQYVSINTSTGQLGSIAIPATVTAASNLTDNYVVRGDGGAKGVQTSTIAITDAGEMTNASQPAFLAYLGAAAVNLTGDGTAYTLGTDNLTEVYDVNSNFNVNGTFTAPVTGKHHFNCAIDLASLAAGHTTGYIQLVASNRTLYLQYINPYAMSAGGACILNGCAYVDMDAGDTATISLKVSGAAKAVGLYGSASPYATWFSGILEI